VLIPKIRHSGNQISLTRPAGINYWSAWWRWQCCARPYFSRS